MSHISQSQKMRPVSTTTTVRIEVELYLMARRRNINLSKLLNQALRSILKQDDEEDPDLVVAKWVKEREKTLEAHIKQDQETEADEKMQALQILQHDWNIYISSGPKDTDAKLSWIHSRKAQIPLFALVSNEELLKELEG